MKFSYHAFSDTPGLNTCSLQSDEFPLIVNCSGNLQAKKAFSTDNVHGREDFYLLYMVQGRMTAPLGEITETVSDGDVLIFPPKFRYRYSYDGKEPMEYYFVHFTGSYAEQFLVECGFGALPCLLHTHETVKIPQAFQRLFAHFSEKDPLQKHELACALERLLLTVAHSLLPPKTGGAPEKALRIIHTAYHTDLRIPALAKEENLSHSRFIEVFREATGMSPTAYLIRLRLHVACDLLKNTDMSVKEIAQSVGYNDPHFFSKLFKKHIGRSPLQYRERSSI